MKLPYPEMKDKFDHDGYRRGQERELAEANKKRAEQYERKLIREIEEEDERQARGALVDPPPELSPAEKQARENAERLDRMEAKAGQADLERQFTVDPSRFRGSVESREQHERKEALRLLRIRKDGEAQAERNRAHEKHCAKQIKALEQRISDIEARQQAAQERHRQAMGELEAEHTELTEKLGALNASLKPDETTEQRLKAVMV
jgi:hypothetical protein